MLLLQVPSQEAILQRAPQKVTAWLVPKETGLRTPAFREQTFTCAPDWPGSSRPSNHSFHVPLSPYDSSGGSVNDNRSERLFWAFTVSWSSVSERLRRDFSRWARRD